MTEQQYRVIADRDKGDNPKLHDANPGDLLIYRSTRVDVLGTLVRIERPVPNAEMTAMSHETTGYCFCGQMHGRVADWSEADWDGLRRIWNEMQDEEQARRQLAQVIDAAASYDSTFDTEVIDAYDAADAVLALLQRGTADD